MPRTPWVLLVAAVFAATGCSKTQDQPSNRRDFGAPPVIETVTTESVDVGKDDPATVCDFTDALTVAFRDLGTPLGPISVGATYRKVSIKAKVSDPNSTADQSDLLLVAASYVAGKDEFTLVLFDDGGFGGSAGGQYLVDQKAAALQQCRRETFCRENDRFEDKTVCEPNCIFDEECGQALEDTLLCCDDPDDPNTCPVQVFDCAKCGEGTTCATYPMCCDPPNCKTTRECINDELCVDDSLVCDAQQFSIGSGDTTADDSTYERVFGFFNLNLVGQGLPFVDDCLARDHHIGGIKLNEGESLELKIDAVDRQANLDTFADTVRIEAGKSEFLCQGDPCMCCILEKTPVAACIGKEGLTDPRWPEGFCNFCIGNTTPMICDPPDGDLCE